MQTEIRAKVKWAFLRWYLIPDRNDPDVIYLKRLRVIQCPWFAIYIHWIYLPDNDRDMHDHPWHFYSFILRGGYLEQVYDSYDDFKKRTSHHREWKRFSLHSMPITKAHKIRTLKDKTVSLIITGKRVRTWGFWTPEGFVPYHQYDKGVGPDPFMS